MWVLIAILALCVGLRYSLNAFDSNVIDVGYAGVIGAHRIVAGAAPYGNFPSNCGHCDTYGPATYLAYVPFEVASPWHGTWDRPAGRPRRRIRVRRHLPRRHADRSGGA